MSNSHQRYKQREKIIDAHEFSTGFYTTEKYCERMKKHIQKMHDLGGEHLNDIETYKNLMRTEECTNIPSGGSRRRRASKHSKKHRKSRKSNKTKSRRH